MKSLKKDYNERLTSAADAKKALLEKFKARPSLDDPAVAERRAEREALSKAREERLSERAITRAAAEKARIAAEEQARLDAATAHEAETAERAAREAALEIERKAATGRALRRPEGEKVASRATRSGSVVASRSRRISAKPLSGLG